MVFKRQLLRVFGIGAFVLASGYASAQTIVVAADAWCPYNCEPKAKNPGYVVEILRSAYSAKGISVDYRVLPRTRALLDTQSGKVGAVIAANEKEATEYQLITGDEPIGMARGCVFVPSSSSFKYRAIKDLDGLTSVGVVGGIVYQHAFGDWLRRPENRPKIHEVFADDASARRAAMMIRGRLDGIFEDYTEMAYVLETKGLQSQIVSAGCQNPSPLYVAFSAKHPRGRELVAALDLEVRKMRKSGSIQEILTKYGLEDWK
jgi:polar amino acid transport system substrate-binding protein